MALGFLAVYGAGIYDNSGALRDWWNAKKAQNEYEALKKLYEEDTYGGKTPEETLALFIDALKKGDTDLAAKYFVIEEQEKATIDLKEMQINNRTSNFLKDFENAQQNLKESSDKIAIFEYTIYSDGGIVELQGQKFNVPAGNITNTIRLGHFPTGLWKILEL